MPWDYAILAKAYITITITTDRSARLMQAQLVQIRTRLLGGVLSPIE